MTEVTQHLLTQTATIGRLYDKIEKSQGLRFNIFELLNVQYDEVSTHSAFIADLLDPRGSHDRGSIFLKAFYDSILTELKFDPAANYEVAVEHYIGKKTGKEGGRIDILVQKNNQAEIVIENKIRASEQENQLMRYFTFIQKNGHADAILLYLTLNGCESIDKTLSTGKEYTAISYATHILQWLESCTQLAANHPTLRETIVQYVQLIQKLTNQHSNQLMNKEIAAVILKNSSNLKAFFDLQGMGPYIKDQLIKKLEEDITEFCRSSGKVELSKFNLSYKEYTGFEIHNDFLRSKNLAICFEFDLANLSDFCLGFIYIDQNKPTNKQYIKKLQEEFISTFGKHQSSAFWPSYISMPKYTNWDEQTFLAIQDGSFLKAIIESINKLLECAADAE